MARPIGHRGDWFAEWKGENLPCVHEVYFITPKGGQPHYEDNAVGGNPRWKPFIAAIILMKNVILTSDHLLNGVPTDRKAYLSLWRIDNVIHQRNVLRFDFVERFPDRFT